MKATLFIVSSLALAGTVAAENAPQVLEAAQKAMGITGMSSMHLAASGYLAETGEAAGGNAPHPFVKDYEANIDFATPSMRLRIHRTNPDGTALAYGSEELQLFSGAYAWDQYPGEKDGMPGGGPPGGGASPNQTSPPAGTIGPSERIFVRTQPQVAATRRMQILLTPPGFIFAALANSATVAIEGANKRIVFSTPDGQRYTGTFDGGNLLTRIVTTDPRNRRAIEVSFSQYKSFNGTRLPAHIVQTGNKVAIAELTVSDVKPNEGTTLVVPPQVQRSVLVDRPAG